MISRRKEPEGKPFLRVPLNKRPVPNKPKKESENRSAKHLQRDAVERGNREQAREANIPKRAKGGEVMKCGSKAGNAMKNKSADAKGRAMVKKKAMGGKVYAKGGSVDGCATKGKTKAKMVKKAMGGMARPGMMADNRGGPAGARMPMMAKGGKTKGKSC